MGGGGEKKAQDWFDRTTAGKENQEGKASVHYKNYSYFLL